MGYKYFNFTATQGREDVELLLTVRGTGIDGTIEIMADRPWTSQGGISLGKIEVKADPPKDNPTILPVTLPELGKLTGKHAIFLKFSSKTKDRSICTLDNLAFQ